MENDSVRVIKEMLGVTFAKTDGEKFETSDGKFYEFYHEQGCCESVGVEEIHGDLEDLIGSPILQAECVTDYEHESPEHAHSYSWTFYKFATIKGSVTVRWLGESNGYYSESVDERTNLPDGKTRHIDRPRCD